MTDLADSLPEFPRKVFTKFFTKICPSQKLRLHQVGGKTFLQIIKWLKDTKLLSKWSVFIMGKGSAESHTHLCQNLHCTKGGELAKSDDNIKLLRIIKS